MWGTLSALLVAQVTFGAALQVDPNGYVVYCPCMGRFGNQADQFLGTLAFAKHLDRTLVLPPWVDYEGGAHMVEFDEYFRVEPLKAYHRVILMREFIKELAPKVWPEEKRIVMCYNSRRSISGKECTDGGCCYNDGSPFGPFWQYSEIEFKKSEFYGDDVPSYETRDVEARSAWQRRFPASKYPVLAFTGPPAGFPVMVANRPLQKYLRWSENIAKQARGFVDENFNPRRGNFIGIHLRNQRDWDNVCKMLKENGAERRHIFASPQCLGEGFQHGNMSMQLCMPSTEMIVKQVRQAVIDYDAKFVFVASDKDHMVSVLTDRLKDLHVRVVTRVPENAQVSLAILQLSEYFIGNCISSFSAFVKRARDVHQLPSGFWGFDVPYDKEEKKPSKTEL